MDKSVQPGISRQAGATKVTGFVTSVPVALTIAGFDPSSGAGITADLKTFSAHGIYGVACISALTVQSTTAVRSVEPLRGRLVRQTLDCLADDIAIAGVKIGMLGSSEVVREALYFLKIRAIERSRVVLDPVIQSTSGAALLDPEGVRLLREELLGYAGWVTPNRAELAMLIGAGAVSRGDAPQAALRLREMAAGLGNDELNIVVTGGDLAQPDDFLLTAQGEEVWIPGEHVVTNATHGTGCALSSALLCRLIAGDTPASALANAKRYVTAALRSAYPVGKGKGPVHHLFRLDSSE
jgi:hydroxymethylpyrimidine/phosphomethylpyrimidine kinase